MKKLALLLLSAAALLPVAAHAYTIIPNDQSQYIPAVQQALQGLPSILYTIILQGSEVLCAGRYSSGCTTSSALAEVRGTNVVPWSVDAAAQAWEDSYDANH